MNTYNTYKDSNIEWIGEIPEHWEEKRIRHLAEIYGRIGYRGYKVTDLVPKGEGAITISPSNMKDFNMQFDNCTYLSWEKYNESPEIMIYKGDILFVKTGSTYGKSSFVQDIPEKATINPQIVVLKNIECDSKLLWYIIKSNNIQCQVEQTVVGGTIPTISQARINNYSFPIPNELQEQKAIAKYLDKKTAEIDQLIADKQKLVDLYQEEKMAIINQAVTKGINPNAKLKDSGIEWLGEIPEHWEVKKLKYVVSLNDESLSENTDDDTIINYIEIGSLNNGIIGSSEHLFKNAPSRARRIVRNGDVIVSTVRTYLKAIAQITENENGYIASTGFAVLRPKIINSNFLGYYSHSQLFIDNTISNSVGVTYPAINASDILKFSIPIPPSLEQIEIVQYIEKESTRINHKIATAEKYINLLTEYRTSLISEVVTGKIKVIEN